MYQFCFSGAAKGQSVKEGRHLAADVGKALARRGHSLLTGATVGLPNYTAEAYKAAGGPMSVGISPAVSKIEHVLKYHLPTKAYSTILYSGLDYIGRDALLISTSDAVVSVGGRLGTLHEFTIAMETETPIGFVEGGGGISEEIHYILKAAGKSRSKNAVFGKTAEEVIRKLEDILNKRHENHIDLYK